MPSWKDSLFHNPLGPPPALTPDDWNDAMRYATYPNSMHKGAGVGVAGAGVVTNQLPPRTGTFTGGAEKVAFRWDARNMLQIIGMRLRVHESQELPFEFIYPHLHGDTVFVFIIAKGESVTLHDDAAMFPSDTLIAQLRLLMETKG